VPSVIAEGLIVLAGFVVTVVVLFRRRQRAGPPPMLVDLPMLIGVCRLLRQIGEDRRHDRLDRWTARQLRLRLLAGRRRSGTDAAFVWVSRRHARRLLRLLDRCTMATETDSRQRHALLALLGVMLMDSLPTHSPRSAGAPAS
jgi:hypothetical protein